MRIHLYTLHLLLTVATAAGAQNQVVIDSLNKLLTNKTGSDRYPPLYELAFEYIDRDNERALQIIQEAEDAALLSGYSLLIVKSMRVKAQVLSRLERFSESIVCGEKALSIAGNNAFYNEQAMVLNSLGGPYAFHLRFDKALEYFFEALHLARAAGDSSLFATAMHNIGLIHYRLENYETALHYLLRALETSHLINEVRYDELRNISLCYAYLKDFDNAEYYLKESLKKCGPSCSDKGIMKSKFAEGLVSYCKEDYDMATLQLFESYALAQKLESIRFQLEIIYLLTDMQLKQKKIHQAKNLLMDGERLIARGSGLNLEKLRIFNMLFKMHLAAGNYREGAFYQNKYITLKDSLQSYGLTTRLMEIESKFKQKENREIIAKQSEIIKLKEQVIARQQILNAVTGLLVLITGAFLFFLFQNYRKKKKLNIVLDQRVKERTHELEVSRNILLSQLRQKDLIISRISGRVREQVRTLKALHSTAMGELSDPIALQYIQRIDVASLQIERCLISSTSKD